MDCKFGVLIALGAIQKHSARWRQIRSRRTNTRIYSTLKTSNSAFTAPCPRTGSRTRRLLAHHWQTLTTSKALDAFKNTIFTLNPRQPSQQCHPLSYDIDFLHDRLSHLLGPCLTEESSFPDPKATHSISTPTSSASSAMIGVSCYIVELTFLSYSPTFRPKG